jgi:ATP-dependent Lon protease
MPYTEMELPEKLPIFLQKEMVPFPYMIFPLFIDDRDVHIFNAAEDHDNLVAIALRNGDQPGDHREIGTLCRVNKIIKISDGKFKVTLEGLNRLKIFELDTSGTIPMAHC